MISSDIHVSTNSTPIISIDLASCPSQDKLNCEIEKERSLNDCLLSEKIKHPRIPRTKQSNLNEFTIKVHDRSSCLQILLSKYGEGYTLKSIGSSYDSGKQIGLKYSCELFLLCYYFNTKAEEWRMSPKTNLQHGRYDSNGLFVKCIPSNISLTSSQAANNSTLSLLVQTKLSNKEINTIANSLNIDLSEDITKKAINKVKISPKKHIE